MARGIRDMRRRIGSVRNIEQITKAMKMVAASKLRRAEAGVASARPYNEIVQSVIQRVLANADSADFTHPFLEVDRPGKTAILVITGNRGLCGAFNGHLIRRALAEYKRGESEGNGAILLTVGRRGAEFFRRQGIKIAAEFLDFGDQTSILEVRRLAATIQKLWLDEEINRLNVVYAWHRTTINYDVLVDRLLPVAQPEEAVSMQYIYEPGPVAVLGELLPSYIETMLFRALLETKASEFGARLAAMDNASRNAADMIKRLTLQMNRLRQATITNELTEIVSGANALKG